MKIQFLSDLHLEKGHTISISKTAPNLALLGDIDNYPFTNVINLLSPLSSTFDNIFYVLGNHEYYNEIFLPMDYILSFLKNSFKQFPNIHILEKNTIDLGDFVIAGTTMWSFIPLQYHSSYSNHLNDYKYIFVNDFDTLTPSLQNTLFHDNVFWLETIIDYYKSSNKKLIVLSHHSPSFHQTLQPKFTRDIFNHAFCSNLTHLFKPPVSTWFFGHTHHFTDYLPSLSTRLLSNPLGNHDELTGFIPNYHINIT